MNFKEKGPMVIEDTVECVEALAEIVREKNLGRIKVSTDDIDIIIEGRQCPPPPAPGMSAAHFGAPAPAPVQSVQVVQAAQGTAAEAVSGNIITSPIVGTFYAASSPDKPPFVSIGKEVSAGDVVCIIESMKLMNEINSEFSGKVAEIYVKNGESVEYGQKLMRIE